MGLSDGVLVFGGVAFFEVAVLMRFSFQITLAVGYPSLSAVLTKSAKFFFVDFSRLERNQRCR